MGRNQSTGQSWACCAPSFVPFTADTSPLADPLVAPTKVSRAPIAYLSFSGTVLDTWSVGLGWPKNATKVVLRPTEASHRKEVVDMALFAKKELSVTEETVYERLASALAEYKPNATYDKPPSIKEYQGLNAVRLLTWSIATGERIRLVGPPGIAKTGLVRWICDQLGFRLAIIAASQITIENLVVPFPTDDEESGRKVLEYLFYEEFADQTPLVVLIDDYGRGHPTVGNTLMELLQEGSLAGHKLEQLVTVVTTDNEQSDGVGKLASMDFAQADRVTTVRVTAADTPWRRHLATVFPEIDLGPLYTAYDRLDAKVRQVISPRVLEYMIAAAMSDFPLSYVLPIIGGQRVALVNEAGSDVTEKTLDALAKALGKTNRDRMPDLVENALKFALRTGYNLYIEGRPGIGKTSYVKQLLRELEVGCAYVSAAVVTPEDLNVPFPSPEGNCLELMPNKMLVRSDRWAFLVDEVYRATRRLQSALMPIMQEKMQGGSPIPGLICTIALNNPREVAGLKMDVGKTDMAVATRFALSIQVDADDIPSSGYLIERYGDVAEPFIEWWKFDLDDAGRVLCTPRCMERMIMLHTAEGGPLPLEWALPYINGERVGVPMVDLHQRLQDKPLARLREIALNVDHYEDELAKGINECPDAHTLVKLAFDKAELAQLEEMREVCARLIVHLDQAFKVSLLRSGGERQRFWVSCMKESAGH